jgi:hypothetical protein
MATNFVHKLTFKPIKSVFSDRPIVFSTSLIICINIRRISFFYNFSF